MKFSIITPCKNRVEMIEETIKSVVNQEFIQNNSHNSSTIEYIIIDGNSNDGTIELIKSYQKKYNFIKLISENDNGMYDALSKGFGLVSGNVVSYINAGDIYNLKAFQIVNSIFSKNKDIEWLTGGKYLYNDKSEIIEASIPYKYRQSLIKSGVYGKYLPFIQQESTFWKRELMSEVNIENLKKLKLAGDYFIWQSFAKKAKLHIVQTHLGGFKIHADQLSAKTLKNKFTYKDEMKTFCKKINIFDLFYIAIDVPFWILSKYFNNITRSASNHIYYNLDSNFWETKQNDRIQCWACDFSISRGEGKLFEIFLNNKFHDKKVYIRNLNNKNYFESGKILIKEKFDKINLNFVERYVAPLAGIFWLWTQFILGKKVIYGNFLPLWNSFLFFFLPPKTILGPITGSIINKNLQTNGFQKLVRIFIIPILYYINGRLLLLRGCKHIFSTSLLKKYLPKKIIDNSKFNYIFDNLNSREYNFDKEIDILIYYRIYPTKSNYLTKSLIQSLSKKKFNFFYFGHKIKEVDDKFYLGFLKNSKIRELLDKTKFSIASEENFLSFFMKECIESHVNLFYNKDNYNELPKFILDSKKIVQLDYHNIEDSILKVTEVLKSNSNRFEKKFNFLNNHF